MTCCVEHIQKNKLLTIALVARFKQLAFHLVKRQIFSHNTNHSGSSRISQTGKGTKTSETRVTTYYLAKFLPETAVPPLPPPNPSMKHDYITRVGIFLGSRVEQLQRKTKLLNPEMIVTMTTMISETMTDITWMMMTTPWKTKLPNSQKGSIF